MVKEVERTGSWQIDRLRKALEFVPADRRRVALDVGAHVGTWTIELARTFKRVEAFEPSPEAYECLGWNTRVEVDGALGARIHIHELALSDRTATWKIVADDKWGPGNTGGSYLLPESGEGEERPIRSVMLDSLFLDELDFIKIDVEGMEPLVLEGGLGTLAKKRPVICWENKRRFAGRNPHPRTAEQILESIGARRLACCGADEVWGWA